jgi:RNA polymerase sigma-70 factor, ECF subfamily
MIRPGSRLAGGAPLESVSLLPDEAIVAQVLAGQVAMFEVLMRRHNERIYRAALAILRNAGEAEDVMQQAYVNAYTNLRQFDQRASFATWITRIAVNEAIARARRRGRYQPFDDDDGRLDSVVPAPMTGDPEREAFAHEMRGFLENAIDALSDGLREVFMLREVQGLTTTETALSLGISEDAVKTRLSRSRAALRRHLFDRVGTTIAESFTFLRPRCDVVVASVFKRIGGRPPG